MMQCLRSPCTWRAAASPFAILLAACALFAPGVGSSASPGSVADPLPRSLDRLFPPQSATPIYREQMAALGFAYSAIFDDLEEGDVGEARRSFERFGERYRHVAALVPEWSARMPAAALEPLAAALSSGDVARSREALLGLRGTCAGCHGPYMTRVQQVFHFGDFRAIRATDPVLRQEVPFTALKWAMQDSFVGITVDARQQQAEKARQHYRDFVARYEALRGTCAACHGAEVPKYVGPAVLGTVERIGALLAAQPIEAERVEALVREVDAQSCFKCHLVHLPAAKARAENR